MDKEKKKERFVRKAKEKFGDKFDYSKVEYTGNCNDKVCIICPEHGEFWTTPQVHLTSRTGCPLCGKRQNAESNTLTTEEFIERARKIHGDKYDYSKAIYRGNEGYVTIICPEHGEFVQRAVNHLRGAGCQKCTDMSVSREEFMRRCANVYGDVCCADKVVYKNFSTTAVFHCEKHGDFEMKPKTFLRGVGCPYCREENNFIEKAKKRYGDKYDYSKVVYKNSYTPVCIIDKERGEFWQKPVKHLKGIGNNLPFDIYGYCKGVAEKYKTMYDFYMNDRKCFNKTVKRGWINDFTWLEKGKIWEDTLHVVYVYEVSDGSVYVGLTKDMEKRDKSHRGILGNGKSSLRDYCAEHGLEIPKPRILKSGLTMTNAQYEEKKWIKKYRDDGFSVINKTDGGEIGPLPFFAYESKNIDEIIKEARQYKNLYSVRKNNPALHAYICKNKLGNVCFPEKQKHKRPHCYTEEFILDIVKKCPRKVDLRKLDPAVHQYLFEHGLLYKYYPHGRVKS